MKVCKSVVAILSFKSQNSIVSYFPKYKVILVYDIFKKTLRQVTMEDLPYQVYDKSEGVLCKL